MHHADYAALGCANPLVLPPGPPLIQRQSSSTFTDWDLLRRGYELMGVNKEDGSALPGSLFEKQALVHEAACNDRDPSNDVHQNGLFLIWHRAFLYFHERALNQVLIASGDIAADRIRLPYWEWDSVQAEVIPLPEQYAIPKTTLANPARTWNPAPSIIAKDHQFLGDWLCILTNMVTNPVFEQAQNSIGSAHGTIHDDLGGPMNDLMKAAFDPLFYAHHSEVDRLFETWKRSHGAPPAISEMAAFVGPDGQSGCYRLADFLDAHQLGYDYDSYPTLNGHCRGAHRMVLSLEGLRNPAPHQWAFVMGQEPVPGDMVPMKGFIGYGLPASGMQKEGRLEQGAALAFLVSVAPREPVWATTVDKRNQILRVETVPGFEVL